MYNLYLIDNLLFKQIIYDYKSACAPEGPFADNSLSACQYGPPKTKRTIVYF